MGASIVGEVPHAPSVLRKLSIAVATVASMFFASGCLAGQVPPVPVEADGTQDPVLVAGREVWADNCVRCHGADGGGGRGPKLKNGAVAFKYPNVDVQRSIVIQGLNGKMPGFRTVLTPDEIEAVVDYTRKVL